jgi:hypothetical protein
MRLGIGLLSGIFGRFDFDEARYSFDQASISSRFAAILRDSLSVSDLELVDSLEFSSKVSVFSSLRNPLDESIPLIRL